MLTETSRYLNLQEEYIKDEQRCVWSFESFAREVILTGKQKSQTRAGPGTGGD